MSFSFTDHSLAGRQNERRLRMEPLEERRLLVADMDTGLVGFWKLDEASIGQAVADASGLDNSGTHVNIVSPQGPSTDVAVDEGTDSRSLDVDGTNDYVRIPAGSSLDFTGGSFTLSVWIDSDITDTSFHGVIGSGPGPVASRGPSLWVFQQSRIHGGFGDGTNWNSFVTDPVLVAGEYNHVVSTFDGSTYRAYVNGSLVLSTGAYAGRTPAAFSELNIGRADNYFDGRIDHVRVYTRSLTAEDVSALFAEGVGEPPPPPPPPSDGLVAHWKLDETSIGQTVADASGLGNTGTHVNIVSPQGPSTDVAVDEGTASRSLLFDGTDDYVRIVGNSTLDLSAGPFSQSLWIRPTSGNIGFHGVLGLENGLAGRAPSIWVLDNDRLHAGFGDGSSFHSVATSAVLDVDEWNHVATTYDGSVYRLYVDGLEVSTLSGFTGQAPPSLTTLNIGRVDNYFQGGVDDVRIFNLALTSEEVAQLAQLEPPPPPPPPPSSGLVGHWRLDEDMLGEPAVEETGVSQPGVPLNFAAPNGPSTDVAVETGPADPHSLSFDGIDDFVQITNSPALDMSGGQFTQSVWIKPNHSDNDFHGVLGYHPSLVERAPSIWVFQQDRIHAGFGDGTDWNSVVTPSVLDTSDWNHVVVTFDGTTYGVYHDGLLVFSTSAYAGRVPTASSRMDIGRVDNHFAGLIDDVRVYNRALSAGEIADLYTSARVGPATIALEKADVFVDEGATIAQVTLLRTGDATTQTTVDYSTISGTATPGSDYVQTSGEVVFLPDQTSATITVDLLDDTESEPTESFGIAIDSVGGGILGNVRTANVKIFDDDPADGSGLPVVVLTGPTFLHDEDGGDAVVTLFRAGSTTGAVDVSYIAFLGSATPDVDFTPVNDVVTIPAGERLASISIPIIDDTEGELNETVNVAIYDISGGVFGSQTLAQVVIVDNDPGEFDREVVAAGLSLPTSFDFLPDGRILIAEKGGVVNVASGGGLLPTPFIDLSAEVNDTVDRGLLGLAVHPDFPTEPYVYLLYVYDPPETQSQTGLAAPDQPGNRVSRLIRVEADPATNFATAIPGSEEIILGANSVWANISHPELDSTDDLTIPTSCGVGSTLDDCLAVDSVSHSVGLVAFGGDGALYVSTGDASSIGRIDPRAARVQDVDSLSGKILRIDPITGLGLSDNPFFDPADAGSNRSKVYSYGLRNPFRFAFDPQTSEPYIGDVGWNNWEEVDTGGGANFGWPFYEGGTGVPIPTNGYQDLQEAQDFYASGEPTVAAIHARSHGEGAVAITMGDFYTGVTYPALYHGSLFFADFLEGTIDVLSFDAEGGVAGIQRFADNVPGIVQMKMGSDDNLYFVNIFGGTIERFVPVGSSAARPSFALIGAPGQQLVPSEAATAAARFRSVVADGVDSQAQASSASGAAPVEPTTGHTRIGLSPAIRDRAVELLYAAAAGERPSAGRLQSLKAIGRLSLWEQDAPWTPANPADASLKQSPLDQSAGR